MLRGADGATESASGAVFPDTVPRVLRGTVVGAGECGAGGRFSAPSGVPRSGWDRGGADPLAAVADASADRRGDDPSGFHVGARAAVRSGVVRGKTVGGEATPREANAARRSSERRDTGEAYEAFVQRVAEASGSAPPPRAELARGDRSRKAKKTSNKAWPSPQDPDAQIPKLQAGRTHLAPKAAHGVALGDGRPCLSARVGCVGGRFGDAARAAADGGRAGRRGSAGR